MIFGHRLHFTEFSELDYKDRGDDQAPDLFVSPHELPAFTFYTGYMPHSLQEVRYGALKPFDETLGYRVSWTMEVRRTLQIAWLQDEGIFAYQKGERFTPELLRFWLYHTFLPLHWQMQRRYQILHAGAVEIADRAAIFIGPSHAGKSTLTDYCVQRGRTLMADDTLAIEHFQDERYQAVAAWPYRRPYRQVETLGEYTPRFVTQPLQIGAIFRLRPVSADDPVTLTPLQGIDKFTALHQAQFIPLGFLKDRHFAFLGAFAHSQKVLEITVPRNLQRLEESYQTIYRRLTSS